MEIVVEYVLIDNLVINFIILYLSCKILKSRVVFWKLALSSCIGAGFALVMPLMILPVYVMILFKLILGVVMALIALPCQTFKKSVASFLTFILMTAGMGGVCFLIIFMISGTLSIDLMMTYDAGIPIGVILLICTIFAFMISALIKLFYQKKILNNFIYPTTFIDGDKKIRIDAYLDTGNTLIDPITNKPVVIVNYSLFNRLFEVSMEKIISKKIEQEDLKNSHYINFSTLGQKADNMLVFEIEKIQINLSESESKEFDNVVLGLSFTQLKRALSCDALLHPQLFVS